MARTTARTRRIDDAGRKIGGARKDVWRDKAMVVADLEALNPEESAEFVTKDHVWPVPDYARLVADGMDPEVAGFVKIMRDRMSARPNLRTLQYRTRELRSAPLLYRDYVTAVGHARDVLLACRDIDDVRRVYGAFRKAIGYPVTSNDPEVVHLYSSIAKDNVSPLATSWRDKARVRRMLDDGWPAPQPAWRKGVRALHGGDGKWFLVKDRGEILGDGFEDEAAAWKWREGSYAPKAKDDGPDVEVRPHLKHLVRSGLTDVRSGRDVSPEDFIRTFGFMGVEFGNWLPDSERQQVLNLGYDALHDLASVMGLEPGDMGLDGQLSVAFGARGKGGAAAHYESARRVINMTRLGGAGSLAHEYGHALDHVSGEVDRTQPGRGDVRSGSGWRTWTADRKRHLPNLSPDVASTWDGTMSSLRSRPRTKEDQAAATLSANDATRRAVEKGRQQRERHVAARPGGADATYLRKMDDWLALQERTIKAREETARRILEGPSEGDFGTTETSYLKEAKKLSPAPGGYYVRPTEMFARAFEAAVFDRLAEAGGRNDYLVHGVEGSRYEGEEFKGNPYPSGQERASLTAAVMDVVEAMAPRLRSAPAPAMVA